MVLQRQAQLGEVQDSPDAAGDARLRQIEHEGHDAAHAHQARLHVCALALGKRGINWFLVCFLLGVPLRMGK